MFPNLADNSKEESETVKQLSTIKISINYTQKTHQYRLASEVPLETYNLERNMTN